MACIYFIGMGTSGTLGKYGARYISNLGLKAFYFASKTGNLHYKSALPFFM